MLTSIDTIKIVLDKFFFLSNFDSVDTVKEYFKFWTNFDEIAFHPIFLQTLMGGLTFLVWTNHSSDKTFGEYFFLY
jgi:hypothetical protein